MTNSGVLKVFTVSIHDNFNYMKDVCFFGFGFFFKEPKDLSYFFRYKVQAQGSFTAS